MSAALRRHASQLAALGSPVRLALLRRIVQGHADGTAVGDLRTAARIPWSTLSHHLESLASTGLVRRTKRGRFVLYRADFDALDALTDYLWDDCCAGGGAACCPTPPKSRSRCS